MMTGVTMVISVESMTACTAAFMLALSPITGSCEGRTLLLCSGDNERQIIFVWDDEGPLPPRSHKGASKACHACMFDKRKAKPEHSQEADDA